MKWYWYVANKQEIFLDLDRYESSIKHIRARLQGAIESEKLPLEFLSVYPSGRDGHFHAVLVLSKATRYPERLAWSIVLHSDIYRACNNLMRWERGVPAYDILIANRYYHRIADATCECEGKHKRAVMEQCPAAKQLRGEYRSVGFFGKPSSTPSDLL